MRTFAALGTVLILLVSVFAFSAAAQNPGHGASQIGPGTFAGSGTWTFPGNIVASGTICGSAGCAGSGGTGGTCSCPWTSQSWGLQYAGTAGVTDNLRAQQICDENGANCKDISTGWSTGGTSYWTAATLQGVSGISYNSYIGAAKYCDTGGTTCKSITEMGGTGTCTCPSIWTEPAAGITYYMGNVGIGKSSGISQKLDVAGNIVATGTICDTSGNCVNNGRTQWSSATGGINYASGRVGIGTAAPSQQLHVAGNVLASGNLMASQICDETGANCKDISTGWSSGATSQWTGTTSLYYNGNVGIGVTSAPTDRLVVTGGRVEISTATEATESAGTGALEIADSLRIDGDEIITNSGTTLYLQNGNNGGDINIGGGNLYVNQNPNNPGNVGIGTTSISGSLKLDVEGQVGATQYCDASGGNCHTITDLAGVTASELGREERSANRASCSVQELLVSCSSGKVPVGGGCAIGSATGNQYIERSTPTSNGWSCWFGGDNIATVGCSAYAICINA
jgi:hypothetical protein